MQHTKLLKIFLWVLLLLSGLVAACLLLLHPWRLSILNYFKKMPTPFETIATYLDDFPDQRKVLLIRRIDLNHNFADVDPVLPEEVQTSIRDIFKHSDCKTILLSKRYCKFSASNRTTEHGILYLREGASGSDPLLGCIVRKRQPLYGNWMYYEVLTPLAEKDVPG